MCLRHTLAPLPVDSPGARGSLAHTRQRLRGRWWHTRGRGKRFAPGRLGDFFAALSGLVLLMPRGPVTAAQALVAVFASLPLGFRPAMSCARDGRCWSRRSSSPSPSSCAGSGSTALLSTRRASTRRTGFSRSSSVAASSSSSARCRCCSALRCGTARRRHGSPSRRLGAGRALLPVAVAVAVAVGVGALVFFIARPGTTPPITDASGNVDRRQHRDAREGRAARRRAVDLDPRLQRGEPCSALPARRTRPERHAVHAVPLQRHRQGLRRRGLGSARQRQVMAAIDPTSTYTLDSIVADTAGSFRAT